MVYRFSRIRRSHDQDCCIIIALQLDRRHGVRDESRGRSHSRAEPQTLRTPIIMELRPRDVS